MARAGASRVPRCATAALVSLGTTRLHVHRLPGAASAAGEVAGLPSDVGSVGGTDESEGVSSAVVAGNDAWSHAICSGVNGGGSLVAIGSEAYV